MSSVRPEPSGHDGRVPGDAVRTTVRGDLALFHRSLADLCRANVPLPRALRVLQADLERGPMAREATAMADEIEQGVPLAEAYAKRKKWFSPVYRALIQAGMSGGGALPDVLDEIAIHASDRAQIVDRMRRTMAYPLVATGFVVAIGAAILTFVGSPLREAYALGGSFTPTRAPVWQTWGGAAIVALAILGVVAFTFLRRPLDEGVGPRSIGYKLPLIGRLRTYAAKASFASTMALLLRRAIPLPRALALTATATDDPGIRNRIERMANAADGGSSLSEAVDAGALLSPSLSFFLEAAHNERTAADALDDIASIYRQRLERSAERVAIIAAPAAQLIVGLVVLGFALNYMTSAFGMVPDFDSLPTAPR
ncbi:MAG: type II secretion system F family protein [Planctomycetes bacterium]|nr:type II secretion system F family protein [Planctomycetota bacterium]